MFVDSDNETKFTVKGIVLPNLLTLELHVRSERDTMSFLDALNLPNLTSLKLGEAGCGESTLHQLVNRSGMKKMEELIISKTVLPLLLGTLLEILPSLCHLEIHTRIILDMSTMHRIGSGELGPRLRALHLRGNQELELNSRYGL